MSASAPVIIRTIREDGVCVLTFDRPNSSANILDPDTLSEVAEHLNFVGQQSDLRGLVIASAKPSIFIAGADLKVFRGDTALDQVRQYIEQGQRVMNRLAVLAVPTVAAIHGAALGGGYEICLACRHRVASSEKVSRIGLPETQLGLLPAWGGPTRLARRIGPEKASEVICRGKTLTAEEALQYGLVDELVPQKDLLEVAARACVQHSVGTTCRSSEAARQRGPTLTPNSQIGSKSVDALPGPRHFSPAILKAKDVITRSVSLSVEESLALECEAFLELVQSEATQNLVRLFFLEDRAKKRCIDGVRRNTETFSHAAVIGAGTMGAGIALWLSGRKLEVALRDVSEAQLAKGMEHIRGVFRADVARGTITAQEAEMALARIHPERTAAVRADVEIVIEAVFEELDVKKEIFCRVAQQVGSGTILATNTSALPIGELSAVVSHPERVIGLHFFNPVHRMSLVEIIPGEQTAPEVAQRCLTFTQRIGKLPVVVRDVPGFVANRVLTPYLNEAQRLFESGVPIEELDCAMLEFGFPMGPMRLLDEIGLPVELRIAETLEAAFGARLEVPDCLRRMIAKGWLGRKSGLGYYVYAGERAQDRGQRAEGSSQSSVISDQKASGPVPNLDAVALLRHGEARRIPVAEIQDRLLSAMTSEAARCVAEKVVDDPDDVDFVMVKGTGFPPWKGGPLRYAKTFSPLPSPCSPVKDQERRA